MPALNVAANVGLILFLFLVGLEVDLRLLVRNWKISLGVGAAGMALPFGLGCGIAYGLYHEFGNKEGVVNVSFGTYMLFVGVAMAITAFPVLCRILTELNILSTQVGVVVLSAGVGNDIVGWILLALCVALVNAGSGISALYVFLVEAGYVLLLIFAVRPAFLWLLRRTRSIQNGPSQSIVGLTILMVFMSAFFTSIIGVHQIFGAFLIGIICPHEGGFSIKIVEKIEDLVAVFFLPLYFALSGLSTNLGLLNNGITWAYVVGIIAIAFFGKVTGGTLAARASGLVWRESSTIGVLMSCKGLVELIVLNIGLQAKILSVRTFTMFVVMALVTTFATARLVSWLWPPWYQKKLEAWKRGEIDWNTGARLEQNQAGDQAGGVAEKRMDFRRLLVCLRLDSLPSLFTFVSLLTDTPEHALKPKVHPSKMGKEAASDVPSGDGFPFSPPLKVHGLRVLELTERLSSVMKESETVDRNAKDPVVNAFYTFGQLNNVATSGEVQVIAADSFANVVNGRAHERTSDLILLPWSETGNVSELESFGYIDAAEGVFKNEAYNHLIGDLLSNAPCTTAVLVSNKLGSLASEERPNLSLHRVPTNYSLGHGHTEHVTLPVVDPNHHVFCPFSGGPDDRAALHFALRLAKNVNITVTILFVSDSDIENTGAHSSTDEAAAGKSSPNVSTQPVHGGTSGTDRAFFQAMQDSVTGEALDRIVFDSLDSAKPLADVTQRAASEVGQHPRNAGDLVIVGRSSTQHPCERGSLKHTLGDRAEAIIGANLHASVIVVQAPTTQGTAY